MIPSAANPKAFLRWVTVMTEFTAGTILALLLVVIMNNFGGFGITNHDQLHNWHVLLMPLGLGICLGNAIIIYRLLASTDPTSYWSIERVKYIHLGLHCAGIAAAIAGIIAAFHSRFLGKRPHMYSMHSWLGLITLILLGFQVLGGIVTYIVKIPSRETRDAFAAVHAFFGLCTFIMSSVVIILGLDQKGKFIIYNYTNLPVAALLVNTIGILCILFLLCIVYIAINPYFEPEYKDKQNIELVPVRKLNE